MKTQNKLRVSEHNLAHSHGTRIIKISYENVTGKAIPLQALTGPEGSRRLRLPDFKTIGT
jgi:hypothetical protein